MKILFDKETKQSTIENLSREELQIIADSLADFANSILKSKATDKAHSEEEKNRLKNDKRIALNMFKLIETSL